MPKPPIYKAFSDLVKFYRSKKSYSIRDVYNHLKWECDFEISYDAVRKYDRGLIEPQPEYVELLRHCLRLTEDQWKSLVDAIIGDYTVACYYQYSNAKKLLYEKGSPCVQRED